MRFALFDHQGKGARIADALVAAGWQQTPYITDQLDVLLVDHDGPHAHPRPEIIAAAHEAGAKIVLYPHGAAPTVTFYDGAYAPNSRVHARLEHGPGHVEIGRRIGLTGLRQHVVGWTYSDRTQHKRSRTRHTDRILFAPIQPNGNGELADYDHHTNEQAWAELVGRFRPDRIVVHQPNGPAPVEFAVAAIQQANFVVAAGTFAHTALALGKPVVMIHDRNLECATIPAHLDLYDDYQTYPLTIREPGDLARMVLEAYSGSARLREWTDLFVGGPMINVAALLEEIVTSAASSDGRATARRAMSPAR